MVVVLIPCRKGDTHSDYILYEQVTLDGVGSHLHVDTWPNNGYEGHVSIVVPDLPHLPHLPNASAGCSRLYYFGRLPSSA